MDKVKVLRAERKAKSKLRKAAAQQRRQQSGNININSNSNGKSKDKSNYSGNGSSKEPSPAGPSRQDRQQAGPARQDDGPTRSTLGKRKTRGAGRQGQHAADRPDRLGQERHVSEEEEGEEDPVIAAWADEALKAVGSMDAGSGVEPIEME